MRHRTHATIALAAVLLAVACWGCQPEEPTVVSPPLDRTPPGGIVEIPTTVPDDPAPTAGDGQQPTADPPEPETIPKVSMTKELIETCLVRVDDTMPDAGLRDLEGKPQSLAALRGTEFSVVCFWRSGEALEGVLKAGEILGDLQALYETYSQQGLQIIGINEGDTAETIAQRLGDAKALFPNVVDPEGALFDKIATERLPRLYLLDSEGKILWFDLEYSLATRRSLEKALQVVLGEKQGPAQE